jgi:hypothetical protein
MQHIHATDWAHAACNVLQQTLLASVIALYSAMQQLVEIQAKPLVNGVANRPGPYLSCSMLLVSVLPNKSVDVTSQHHSSFAPVGVQGNAHLREDVT